MMIGFGNYLLSYKQHITNKVCSSLKSFNNKQGAHLPESAID